MAAGQDLREAEREAEREGADSSWREGSGVLCAFNYGCQ